MQNDFVTPAQRVNPKKRVFDFFGSLWLIYQYKIACWEMEKQAKHEAEWRWVAMQCQDRLRQLGVNPNERPEDLTKMFEVWIMVGILLVTCFGGVMFVLYRSQLIELMGRIS